MRPTFHLVPAQTWDARDPEAAYSAPSLASEGFIHCTDGPVAMVATANRHYREDPQPFVVLTIDLDAAGSAWRFDDPAMHYPHVYGPIAPPAILRALPFPRAEDGTFLPFEEASGANPVPEGVSIERIFVIEAMYGPDAETLRPLFREEHLARIARLMAAGRLIEAGGHLDFSTSLLFVRAASEDEAIELVRDDVYVRTGVWTADFRAKPFGRVVLDREASTPD